MARTVGLLLLFEALMLLACCGVSLGYGEDDLMPLVLSTGVCAVAGGGLLLYGRRCGASPNRSEAYIIVALSWVFFSGFGMLPYLAGGYIPSVTDAFFETMSGFTTTGATILDDIERLPHGILFWRSLTQWIGGLGIVFFTIALLPGFGGGGQLLFLSEATGVTHDKIHPKTKVMVRYIGTVYLFLTAVETVLLMFGGMDLFMPSVTRSQPRQPAASPLSRTALPTGTRRLLNIRSRRSCCFPPSISHSILPSCEDASRS